MTAFLALTLLCAPSPAAQLTASPQPHPGIAQEPELTARLTARAKRAVEPCVGLEVLVLVGEDPLVHLTAGADAAGTARAEGAAFRAPALLRPLVALAALRRLGDGAPGGAADGPVLELDRPLGALVPDVTLDDAPTLRQLLAGTSGLAAYDDVLTREERANPTPGVLRAAVARAGFVAGPGTCFDPNESEVLLVASALEALSGGSLADVVRGLGLTAGLESTGFAAADEAPPTVTAAERFELDLELRPAAVTAPFDAQLLCTTVPDLARLARAVADRRVLDEARLAELIAPGHLTHGRAAGTATGYGLGLDLVRLGDFAGVTAGGSGAGGTWHVVRYADADLTIVLAATAADASLADVGRDLARTVLGLAPPGVQDLALGDDEVRRFAGGYQLGCDRLVVAQAADGHLTLSGVDRPVRVLLSQGAGRFVAADDAECAYEFVRPGDDGRASVLVMLEHGQRTEAVRIE